MRGLSIMNLFNCNEIGAICRQPQGQGLPARLNGQGLELTLSAQGKDLFFAGHHHFFSFKKSVRIGIFTVDTEKSYRFVRNVIIKHHLLCFIGQGYIAIVGRICKQNRISALSVGGRNERNTVVLHINIDQLFL